MACIGVVPRPPTPADDGVVIVVQAPEGSRQRVVDGHVRKFWTH